MELLMGEINSLIGIKQLEDLDSLLKSKETNALIWDAKLLRKKI